MAMTTATTTVTFGRRRAGMPSLVGLLPPPPQIILGNESFGRPGRELACCRVRHSTEDLGVPLETVLLELMQKRRCRAVFQTAQRR
jgi:hypothetical protein